MNTQSAGNARGQWVIQFNQNTTADFVNGVCTSEQDQVYDVSTGEGVKTMHSMDINCTVEEPKVSAKSQKLGKRYTMRVKATKDQVKAMSRAMPNNIDLVQLVKSQSVSTQSVEDGRMSTQSVAQRGITNSWMVQFNSNTSADFVSGVCTSTADSTAATS